MSDSANNQQHQPLTKILAELTKVKLGEIIACGAIRELNKAVSERIGQGGFRLIKQPFKYQNQICQAIGHLRFGE